MDVLDALKGEVYSSASLKIYRILRDSEPLLKPYPTFDSFLEAMQSSGKEAGQFQDQILLRFIQFVQEKKHQAIVQAWLVYLFIPKLKTLKRKYFLVDDGDLIWETLHVINKFNLQNNPRFVAQRFSKLIEFALIRIHQKAAAQKKIHFISTSDMEPADELSKADTIKIEPEITETGALIKKMNELGVPENVQVIILKQLNGQSLEEIARALGKKYNTIQKRLIREKQRLEKLSEKKAKKY